MAVEVFYDEKAFFICLAILLEAARQVHLTQFSYQGRCCNEIV